MHMGKVCKNICYVDNITLIFGNSMNQVRVFVFTVLYCDIKVAILRRFIFNKTTLEALTFHKTNITITLKVVAKSLEKILNFYFNCIN